MRLTIWVTADDIEQGERRDCDTCAVALAARRKIHPRCWVANKYIMIPGDQSDASYLYFPERVVEWIRKFDGGKKVKPIRFAVEVADEILQKLGRSKS